MNLELNEFYDYKVNSFISELKDDDISLDRAEQAAHEYTARWLMIPLTRAMDTLVIHVSSSDHKITKILRQVSDKYRDFVEWRKIE